MKLEVTRDVVSDLWPLYRAGDASPDSRGLVEAFLAGDAAFASTLKESETLSHVVPPVRLSPEGELRLLQDAQQRAREMAAEIGVDRLTWEITDHPEDAFSRRFVPGSSDYERIKYEIWDTNSWVLRVLPL
jgi:hypothetical protein